MVSHVPNKIVLAYSGGLDTSTLLCWLQETYRAEVIAFIGDVGQPEDIATTASKAEKLGADKVVVRNLKERFLTQYAFPCLQAGALYQGRYPMASSISRPILIEEALHVASEEGADAIAHGASGKGNDQLRFALASAALAPEIPLMAPLIDWPLQSREDQVAYASERGIEVPVTREATYSYDESLWGRSIGCGPIEDLTVPVPEKLWAWTRSPQDAPDTPQSLELEFEQGVPVALDDERLPPVELVARLNAVGGEHGVGRIEQIEDKVVGIKSRELYESPGATILHRAHQDLEELTLDKPTLDFKRTAKASYAELAYAGSWFSPLRMSLHAFVHDTQRFVNGVVAVQLYKGNCLITGRRSDYALYDYALSTYDSKDSFDHEAGRGFTTICALPDQISATIRRPSDRNG